MKDFQTLSLHVDKRGVAQLELALEKKRNALSALMIEELTHFAQWLAHTKSDETGIRVVVLSGRGSVFCAGGDLAWMKAQIHADRNTRMKEARKLAEMLKALNEMPVPLIGNIHGGAFGGGVGLACVCDVAIAEENTKFGLTETRLGLIPATIAPYVLARMGEGKARQIFMSSRIFNAHEAQSLGLLAKVCSKDTLKDEIEQEVVPYLSAAPQAVAAAKALARSLGPVINAQTIDETVNHLADTWETPQAAEGINAFLNKHKPSWG